MTGQDIDKLFELLAIFRPGDKHLLDRTLRNAWLLILKPYAPDDVREAVAEYFRHNKYWPDVTDIATLCPEIPKASSVPQTAEVDRRWRKQRERLDRYEDLKRRRREAGLPETFWDAKDAGMSLEEYDRLTEAAGLEFEVIL